MDVDQIRAAFLDATSLVDRLREFRLERLKKFSLGQKPKAILHLIPETFLSPGTRVELGEANHQRLLDMRGNWVDASQLAFNFDGVALVDSERVPQMQVFRSGIIEVVLTNPFWDFSNSGARTKCLSGTMLERAIVHIVGSGTSLLEAVGTTGSVWVLLTLAHVGHHRIADNAEQVYLGSRDKKIDRSQLMFPELLIESRETDLPIALRPLFDQIWNSGGHYSSCNYTSDGIWKLS